jgi:hypothetical protein
MPQRSTNRRVQATTIARAGWGCALLLVPDRVLRVGGRPPAPPAAVTVARVLGARQLMQSAITVIAPTGLVMALGTAVDALHAGTDIGLAAVSPRWRRIALVDAFLAAAFATCGTARPH